MEWSKFRSRVVVAGLLACGVLYGFDAARAASQPRLVAPPRDLGRLLPTDAVALIYVRSVEDAQACLRALQQAGGESDSLRFDLLTWATHGTGVQPAHVERRRPLALAFSLGGMGQPLQTTAILPIGDRRGFDADRAAIPAGKTAVVQGGYVGISALPGYAAERATPAFAAKLLDGPITARLRPHQVAPLARFFAAAAFGRALGTQCADSLSTGTRMSDSLAAWCAQMRSAQTAVRGVCDAMDAIEAIDLGLQADQGLASLAYTIAPLAGHRGILPSGEQARAATDLARCLGRDFPAVGFGALDFARLASFTTPLAEAMGDNALRGVPAGWREPLRVLQRTGLEMQQSITGGTLGAIDFGPRGLEWVRILGMADAERLAARHRDELLRTAAQVPGLQITAEPATSQGGTPIAAYRLRFDPARLPVHADSVTTRKKLAEAARVTRQLFGGDELVVRIAGIHDKLILVGAREPALMEEILTDAQRAPAAAPAWLAPVLASPPDTLCWYMHADLRTVLQPIVEVAGSDSLGGKRAEALAKLAAAPPAPVTLRGTVGRGLYRGELRADVAGIRAVFGAVQPLLPARPRHVAPPGAPRREP